MMTSLPEIVIFSQNKTRVLLFTSLESVSNLVLDILHFNGKNFDYFLKNRELNEPENDFVILETSDVERASAFLPNIVFISDEYDFSEVEAIFKNIISGGILVYPKKLEQKIDELPFFFRKLPFSNAEFKKDHHQIILQTEMGLIPINSSDENLVKNLEGIKLLSQQFGVLNEEFYEPVMGFNG